MPVVHAGIDDIVWVAGDISSFEYTRTGAAIRTAFSMGQIEKVAALAIVSALFSAVRNGLENFAKFPSAESKF